MKLRHRLPFGAEPEAEGVRFRLWAPAVKRVDVLLDDGKALPMAAEGGGWFGLVTAEAEAGTRYRYRLDGGDTVPDPGSRFNPDDVHGPSEVIDPAAYEWADAPWRGRPWHETVLYELHVGAFTPEGTFRAAAARLPYLRDLGITAVELMPVADFAGTRNWGYDGVLPFAPDAAYGRPEELKAFVEAAHCVGLMVFFDVVYNHFGPEGNYLNRYAPAFFTERHHTPWGAALNYDGRSSRPVRDFAIENALYWIEEFHADGLRLDAVHAIIDDSEPDVLTELALAVRSGPGLSREIHLVLENDANVPRYLARDGARPRLYDAQWNDDAHHALHVLLTGEDDGYYGDYAGEPVRHLARTLAEGFAYQGERSKHRGHPRGETSRSLPSTSFVAFLQNHDQVGNRAVGARVPVLAPPEAVRAGLSVLLLAPWVPLLFMGEEFGCEQPFPFFCDFSGDLAAAVTAGRRAEFKSFARFHDASAREAIPDPNAPATFELARIDWDRAGEARHAEFASRVRALLALRREHIMPRLPALVPGSAEFAIARPTALTVQWHMASGGSLVLAANLGARPVAVPRSPAGRVIHECGIATARAAGEKRFPPWSVVWSVTGDHE
jgi:malto-oligosyltrehalose trehalohydrolase